MADRKIAHYIKPMLATVTNEPFNNKEWLFELKLDGYRAITEKNGNKLLFYSRNGLDFSSRYTAIVADLHALKMDAVLDGEVVFLNKKGIADFQALQNYKSGDQSAFVYYVFDLLSLGKINTKSLPLSERKELLQKLLSAMPSTIRYCDHIEDRGISFFKKVTARHMEGIMAKKKDSLYTPGIRTKQWLKIKKQPTQEAIIVGFTAPRGSRLYFGSLLLAQYKNHVLTYIGHVGTGFNEQTLKDLTARMLPLATEKSPLAHPVKTNAPATWIKPKLVCEVEYTEQTQDGMLRHPSFKTLRLDKKSSTINAETERGMK